MVGIDLEILVDVTQSTNVFKLKARIFSYMNWKYNTGSIIVLLKQSNFEKSITVRAPLYSEGPKKLESLEEKHTVPARFGIIL